MKHPIIPDIDLDKISFARKYKKLLGNNTSGYLIQVLSKLNLYQQSLKTYYLLSRDPIIIYIGNIMKHTFEIAELLKDEKVYFIKNSYHTFERLDRLHNLQLEVEIFYQLYPQHSLSFICPTESELKLFTDIGIKNCYFINKNAFVDENMFYVIPDTPRVFDAVYNAQLKPYKRFELASNIENLAIITYQAHRHNHDELQKYEDGIRQLLNHATWLNTLKKFVPPCEIINYLNQCKVGLCLSAEEGPMAASIEYMLCGLPVVSTHSLGGREVFFDSDYVEVVEDSAKSISEAVKNLVNREIDPFIVRNKTIQKMKIHREKFINLVESLLRDAGYQRQFNDEFNKIFINKLRISFTFPSGLLRSLDNEIPIDYFRELVLQNNQ
ncbi:glycosyltransferase [Anabaenopsis arnoldii]|uniref:Glycosyltransferase n=1 Tax=Anabaenopsis arnoldii TaxID=2152938 RepID=A0ABT5AUY4_9CYAN|nr:glycosyltransferase [Anabaenopsis arnoldii]MDB9541114.1 glycosyltransferase [Anabaenopsis arnoldii]MDH6093553.1 glycosyltransferase [Anabaenopsis arnoldii]